LLTFLPHLVYQNLPEAIAWLTRVFGFAEHYRYGEPAASAQMLLGRACIMVRQASGDKRVRPNSDTEPKA